MGTLVGRAIVECCECDAARVQCATQPDFRVLTAIQIYHYRCDTLIIENCLAQDEATAIDATCYPKMYLACEP